MSRKIEAEDLQDPYKALDLAKEIISSDYDKFELAEVLVKIYHAGMENGVTALRDRLLKEKKRNES